MEEFENQNTEEIIEENIDNKPLLNKPLFNKFLKLGIILLTCVIVYLLIKYLPHHSIQGDFSKFGINTLFKSIMNATYIICGAFILLIIVFKLSPIESNKKIFNIIANIVDWFVILPICVCICSSVLTYGFSCAEVSGSSMETTLQSGDNVIIFFNNNYKRDDIVVASINDEYYLYSTDKYFIKRLIGLPGDSIKLVEHLDNIVIDPITNNKVYTVDMYINGVFKETYYEKASIIKDNIAISTLNLDDNGNYIFKYINESKEECTTTVIPEGYYFLMGDNRAGSNDSRSIGLVRKVDMVGTVSYRCNDSVYVWEKIENK